MRVRFDYRNSTKMWNEWNTIGETAHTLNRQETVLGNKFFLFSSCRLSNHIARIRLDCLTAQKHPTIIYHSTIHTALDTLTISVCRSYETVPSTNVVCGIRLPPPKEISWTQSKPTENRFVKNLTREIKGITDNPIKMPQNMELFSISLFSIYYCK